MNTKSGAPKQGDTTGYCAFVVGQHVVCITDDFMKSQALRRKWERRGVRYPSKNKVYTVRQVYLTSKYVGVLLEEIRNPLVPTRERGLTEAGFLARKFRPLKKLKIEDFMQSKTPVEGVPA
ncbi:hypothetical protein [Rhizobium phaseoli]|uniref:hypothetical protein n=1 Tax=Rhizobium phaseoli TaxID=396 RepID=UPI002554D636|nr:hypothetical protein [Rhizobium phaseoli]MDK4729364.1 hypothetical protein [Rhizobium phaseoli]